MCNLKSDNPSFVLHGIEDVKIEDVSELELDVAALPGSQCLGDCWAVSPYGKRPLSFGGLALLSRPRWSGVDTGDDDD